MIALKIRPVTSKLLATNFYSLFDSGCLETDDDIYILLLTYYGLLFLRDIFLD